MEDADHRNPYRIRPIGVVRSSLKRRRDCPHQGSEGAPDAWVEIDSAFADGLEGIVPGCEILLLTWLHEARRDMLKVHPRGNRGKPLRGVFSTRSPNRPNPVGLHQVEVLEIDSQSRLRVFPLEVLDRTPVIDIKPILGTPRGT